jgi:hypothetical protein
MSASLIRLQPAREERVHLLLQEASLVALLSGWSGGILTQPWYRWLSPDELLLRGGSSITDAFRDNQTKDAGKEGMLYRLPVRGSSDGNEPGERPKPVPLSEMSRRTASYGGVGGGVVSPDGRWLLYGGNRPLKKGKGFRDSAGNEVLQDFFWCAVSLDGRRDVAWPMKIIPFTGPVDQTRPWIRLAEAQWLPDSSGIVEFQTDWKPDGRSVVVTGRLYRLDAPTVRVELPPVSLGRITETQQYGPNVWLHLQPTRMLDKASGMRILALYPYERERGRDQQEQYEDPHLVKGGRLRTYPADRVALYEWDWLFPSSGAARSPLASLKTPTIRSRTITMPGGYALFEQRIAPQGDRIVWALMDRAHHAVVATGLTLHPSHGDGKIGLWVSAVDGGDTNRMGARTVPPVEEIGFLPVPREKEAWCYQRFGLGDWVPGIRCISFLFDTKLYRVPVP